MLEERKTNETATLIMYESCTLLGQSIMRSTKQFSAKERQTDFVSEYETIPKFIKQHSWYPFILFKLFYPPTMFLYVLL